MAASDGLDMMTIMVKDDDHDHRERVMMNKQGWSLTTGQDDCHAEQTMTVMMTKRGDD